MLLFPYKDDNPTRSFPFLNWFFIGLNLWVFFAWQLPLNPQETQTYFSAFGFVPESFFGQLSAAPNLGAMAWEWCTVYTSMFSHGGDLSPFWETCFSSTFSETTWRMRWGKQGMEFFTFPADYLPLWLRAWRIPTRRSRWWGLRGRFQESWLAIFSSIHGQASVSSTGFSFSSARFTCPLTCSWAFGLSSKRSPCPNRCSKQAGVAIAAHLGGFGAGLALTPFFKRPGVRMFQSGYSRPFSRNIQKMR